MTATSPAAADGSSPIAFVLDGVEVQVPDDGASLLDALREHLGVHSAKDGCSPQGQCGCCTVLVDGQPRVACVTPVRRVAGRSVTTLDGLDDDTRTGWAQAMCEAGGSQCGFCTPGIIMRLEGQRARGGVLDAAAVDRAMQAHLCRCTGWQTIREAAVRVTGPGPASPASPRDLDAAARRAELEGRVAQRVGPSVALGAGGFAADTAPTDALVAVPDASGGWVVAATLHEARRLAGKVQGRRTTAVPEPPLALPDGDWMRTLRTSWVEPAYLETDVSWCEPGGEPASPVANGGAFGGKAGSPAPEAARQLADQHGRAVRVVLSREDVVRLGPKRPPIAAGVRADGTGIVHVVRTPGIVEAIHQVAPGLDVIELDAMGPPTSTALRGAGWVEAAVLLDALQESEDEGEVATVTSPDAAHATARIEADGRVMVSVRCGDPLDAVVLRSYCIGAAHMALGWVRSEGLAVAPDGTVGDLTIRSFGILRSAETPPIEVEILDDDSPPVNGSDAVFAAVAAAAWRRSGFAPVWPVGRRG